MEMPVFVVVFSGTISFVRRRRNYDGMWRYICSFVEIGRKCLKKNYKEQVILKTIIAWYIYNRGNYSYVRRFVLRVAFLILLELGLIFTY